MALATHTETTSSPCGSLQNMRRCWLPLRVVRRRTRGREPPSRSMRAACPTRLDSGDPRSWPTQPAQALSSPSLPQGSYGWDEASIPNPPPFTLIHAPPGPRSHQPEPEPEPEPIPTRSLRGSLAPEPIPTRSLRGFLAPEPIPTRSLRDSLAPAGPSFFPTPGAPRHSLAAATSSSPRRQPTCTRSPTCSPPTAAVRRSTQAPMATCAPKPPPSSPSNGHTQGAMKQPPIRHRRPHRPRRCSYHHRRRRRLRRF